MSKSLKAIGINSESALDKFAALEKKSREVKKTFGEMGRSIGSLKQKLDLLRSEREWIPTSNIRGIKAYTREIRNLEKQIDSLENKGRGGFLSRLLGGKGGGGGMGGLLMGLGRAALPIAGASLLTMGISNTVNAGMNASRNQASFETLSGKEAGGKLFKDVQQFAQQSIYGNELYDNALQMRAFGIETEKIMPNMKMLGDIAMGNKEKLSSLTLAYSQINSAGRLMGQDLLQLVNAGFNPLTIISQKTGVSMFDLRKKMEDGAISAEMITQAFKVATSEGGQLFNMTQKIAETPFGKWEAFKGQLEGIATNIGMKLLPVISQLIDWFSIGADKVYSLASVLWNDLEPVFQALWPVVQEVGGFLGRILKISWEIGSTIRKALEPILTQLIKLLEGPLKIALGIAEFAFKALQKVVEALAWVLEKVKQAFDWVVNLFSSDETGDLRQLKNIYETQGEAAAKAYVEGFKKVNPANKISESLTGLSNLSNYTVKRGKGFKLVDDIAPAAVPGMAADTFDWNKPFGKDDHGRSKANNAVATGGTKSTTIHISIGKQIETLNVMASNLNEGAARIRDIIVDEMTRALAMSQAIAE